MKTLLRTLAVATAFFATAAQAQIPEPTDAYIVHAKERPVQIVYSWARDGQFFSAFPGDKMEVPYDAAKIYVRLIPFNLGAVRHIHFDAGTRTHPNIGHEDTMFYQISGRRVQIVNDNSGELNPGDASLQLSGIHKRMDQIIAGDMLEFAMPRPEREDSEGLWHPAGKAPFVPVAEWTEGGKTVVAERDAAAKAPASASRYQQKTFALGHYKLLEAKLPKGAKMLPKTEGEEMFFYLVSGKMNVQIGTVKDTVAANDVMRAPAGVSFTFEATEDSHLVYAPIPKAPPVAMK